MYFGMQNLMQQIFRRIRESLPIRQRQRYGFWRQFSGRFFLFLVVFRFEKKNRSPYMVQRLPVSVSLIYKIQVKKTSVCIRQSSLTHLWATRLTWKPVFVSISCPETQSVALNSCHRHVSSILLFLCNPF